ncbi:MAG TPA: SPOR domain-containing protein [Rubrivivax sp.]
MKPQRGGFVIGLVVGLLIGLVLALGVALYVTKVPVPFINKVPQRSSDQDAAEAERNKAWDPNAPLGGRTTPRPAPAAPAASASAAAVAPAKPARDPAAILSGAATPGPAGAASVAKSAKPVANPLIYFVQAGAFQRMEEAEKQRAQLALLGVESKVVERDQSGRTVFRVRVGPFEKQADAQAAKDRLAAGDVQAVLVRVERPAQ